MHRFPFDAGYPATVGTVQLMARCIREGAQDPAIRARARELFRGLASFDSDGEIRAVWNHVLANVRYQRDPVGAEHLTMAGELDRQVDDGDAAEDCDGMVLYAGALLGAAGIPVLLETQGRRADEPTKFTHVALQAVNPETKQLTSFDPVAALKYPGFSLGDTVHQPGEPIERWDLDGRKVPTMSGLFDESIFFESDDSDDSMGCAFGDIGDGSFDVNKLLKGLFEGGKGIASAFGPTGEVVAGLIQVGEDIYDQATGQYVGKALPTNTPPKATVKAPPKPMTGPTMLSPAQLVRLGTKPVTSAPPATSDDGGVVKAAAGVGVGLLLAKLLAGAL